METNESQKMVDLSDEELFDMVKHIQTENDEIIVQKRANLKKLLYTTIGFISLGIPLGFIGKASGVFEVFGFIFIIIFVAFFGIMMKILSDDSKFKIDLEGRKKKLFAIYDILNKRNVLSQIEKKEYLRLGGKFWVYSIFAGYLALLAILCFVASITEKQGGGWAIAGIVVILLSFLFFNPARKILLKRNKLRNFNKSGSI